MGSLSNDLANRRMRGPHVRWCERRAGKPDPPTRFLRHRSTVSWIANLGVAPVRKAKGRIGRPAVTEFPLGVWSPGSAIVASLIMVALNIRPGCGGRLLLQALDLDATAAAGTVPAIDSDLAREFIRRLQEILKNTGNAHITELRVGVRAMPADGCRPIQALALPRRYTQRRDLGPVLRTGSRRGGYLLSPSRFSMNSGPRGCWTATATKSWPHPASPGSNNQHGNMAAPSRSLPFRRSGSLSLSGVPSGESMLHPLQMAPPTTFVPAQKKHRSIHGERGWEMLKRANLGCVLIVHILCEQEAGIPGNCLRSTGTCAFGLRRTSQADSSRSRKSPVPLELGSSYYFGARYLLGNIAAGCPR